MDVWMLVQIRVMEGRPSNFKNMELINKDKKKKEFDGCNANDFFTDYQRWGA